MTTQASNSQRSRFRIGFGFVLLGIVLLLFVWLSWLYRTSGPESSSTLETQTQSSVIGMERRLDNPQQDQRAAFVKIAPMLLVATFLLVLVFLLGSFILVRGIRRSMKAGDHQREPATSCDDVWSMQSVSRERDEHAA